MLRLDLNRHAEALKVFFNNLVSASSVKGGAACNKSVVVTYVDIAPCTSLSKNCGIGIVRVVCSN